MNSEVKKLLVASVGEDIEARVDFLTQDKARLAADVMQYRWLQMTLYNSEVQIFNIFNHNCAVTAWLPNGRRGMLLESNPTFGKASALF